MNRKMPILCVVLATWPAAATAAPTGSFTGSFPTYSFTAVCADPIGGTVVPGGSCNLIDIDYVATGSTSLFSNAKLEQQTLLVPFLPGPFPFSGTFVLSDLGDPGNSVFGSLAGEGQIAGPPGPPVGFPPFVIDGVFGTTGGTGAFVGAGGSSSMNGTALFTFLSADATFASGEGMLDFTAIPEPGSAGLMLGGLLVGLVGLAARAARRHLFLATTSRFPPSRRNRGTLVSTSSNARLAL